MSYNKDTDYQAKINEAVKSCDYESAAKYEQSRNEKIDKENLDYEKTNHYSGWLDKTDYSQVLKKQMSGGASKGAVSDTLKKRITKASPTVGLSQYAYDDVYDQAISYIMGNGNFSYKKSQPKLKNSYDGQLKRLLNSLTNMKKFSYDPYDDDLYEYYKKQYNREGKRAMEDILGELSSNTGGVASSYAVSAAAQSQDYYNSKLTDKIPELYNDAYERYLDEIEGKERNIELISKLSDREYEKYLDSLKAYNEDRDFEYRAYMDALDSEYRQRESEREQDYLDRKLNEEIEENKRDWAQQAYENSQKKYESIHKENQTEIENALEKWEKLGYLDRESAQILGLPAGTRLRD
ncbi:MAG: hypothetical protein IJZ81_02865 [Clostridia bacterium]|nr:hypothetical protein [Clostridia bacterium]